MFKCPTTGGDPSIGVLNGTSRFAEERGDGTQPPERIIHGTTLVANSLIQRRGARTALLTTQGFTDVLEIARESRYDNYDLDLIRPEPLVARPLRLPVRERVLADGTVLEPLDETDAAALAKRLRQMGVESVAIALINSYVNPVHERMLAEVIARIAPEIEVWQLPPSNGGTATPRDAPSILRPPPESYIRSHSCVPKGCRRS